MIKLKAKNYDESLKEKSLVFAVWGAEKEEVHFRSWYYIFKEIFKNVILFDPRQKRLEYGPGMMKDKLLEIIKKEKPDYIFFLIESGDLNIDTVREINLVSPMTRTIVHFGDDDINFESRSRYYALFVDYCFIGQPHYISHYKKDGLKNALTMPTPVNTKEYKPLDVDKKLDVSFIGYPLESRSELIRYLLKNGIKVELFGIGWNDYEEFKGIYKGALDSDDFVKVVNESKISLGFSRNQYGVPHLKGRVFQIGACKSFHLVEYFEGYKKYFDEGKDIVMFKDRRDLLDKINYYLKHEKERERIAENCYKKVIENYDSLILFKNFFREIESREKYFVRADLPKLKGKIVEISEGDFSSDEKLKEKVENFDYVCFSKGETKNSVYKNYLQAYSLEKTGKEISCCSYYLHDRTLGNYVKFKVLHCFEKFPNEDFNSLLNINQIMITKKFFLNNFEKLRQIYNGDSIDFVDKKSAAFVVLPLAYLNKLEKQNYDKISQFSNEELEKIFQMEFMFKLQSLIYQKRLLSDGYLYRLFLSSLGLNKFILKYLIKSALSKEKWARIER